eukprot:11225137-Lingulodinium_polyedra.AAC.1
MAPKRARRAAAPPSALLSTVDTYIEKQVEQARSSQLTKVTEFLSAHPEQIDRVLIALQEGLFAKPVATKGPLPIPPSRTRIGLLSIKFLQECLTEAAGQDSVDLKSKQAKNGNNTMHKIWYLAMNEDGQTPVFTHD